MSQPNPGSPEAIEQGCRCPILDNGRGNPQLAADRGGFIINGDCPVHAAQLAEVGEGLLDGFLAMCEAGQRVIDNERSSDE